MLELLDLTAPIPQKLFLAACIFQSTCYALSDLSRLIFREVGYFARTNGVAIVSDFGRQRLRIQRNFISGRALDVVSDLRRKGLGIERYFVPRIAFVHANLLVLNRNFRNFLLQVSDAALGSAETGRQQHDRDEHEWML